MKYICTTTCFYENALREVDVEYTFISEPPKDKFKVVREHKKTTKKKELKDMSKEELKTYALENFDLKLSMNMKAETMIELIKQRLEE